jgi:hypothetical protein
MTRHEASSGVRGRLRRRRIAELADRQRLRTGIWFTPGGRICQHCPACAATVSIPDPPETTNPADYARLVDDRLDEAVHDHLLLDLCPTPERAL